MSDKVIKDLTEEKEFLSNNLKEVRTLSTEITDAVNNKDDEKCKENDRKNNRDNKIDKKTEPSDKIEDSKSAEKILMA